MAYNFVQRAHGNSGGYTTARGLARLAPDSALAQVILACEAAFAIPALPESERGTTLAEPRAAAERTLELDPQFLDTYIALGPATPLLNGLAAKCICRKGCQSAARLGASWHVGPFLEQSGQVRAAEPLIQQ